jgi:hypothetical protein
MMRGDGGARAFKVLTRQRAPIGCLRERCCCECDRRHESRGEAHRLQRRGE